MRRTILLPLAAALLSVAACSGSSSSTATSAAGGASAATGAASAAAGESSAAASSDTGGAASAGTGATGGACAAAPSGATAAVTVTIKNFKFDPQPVQAKVGDVIAWTNQDSAPHSATMDTGACDTSSIAAGSSAMLVFTQPGTYTYHCAIHPAQMKDYTIEVK